MFAAMGVTGQVGRAAANALIDVSSTLSLLSSPFTDVRRAIIEATEQPSRAT